MMSVPLQIYVLLLCLCGILRDKPTGNWGFYAHKRINRTAVFTLPAEMMGFYKANLRYITEQAVAADKRRYALAQEAARHYFDTEQYGPDAFDSVPHHWKDALKKYGMDSLNEHGILPWNIARVMYGLTEAFKARDSLKILRYSADLGHYIADAHVPLHATSNYNGQLSGQVGIHAFWESRIPEISSDNYDLFTGKARYIRNTTAMTWTIVEASYYASDTVLKTEAWLNARFASDKKHTVIIKNNQAVTTYSLDYSKRYEKALNGMVERRMREAITMVGSYWFTAWVNAGQPELKNFTSIAQTKAEIALKKLENADHNGKKMLGRPEQ